MRLSADYLLLFHVDNFNVLRMNLRNILSVLHRFHCKQERIPVGYIPAARMPESASCGGGGGRWPGSRGSGPGGCLLPGVCLLPRGLLLGGSAPRGSAPGGVCSRG